MDKSRSQKIYEFEGFRLDAAHRLLYKNGREISLTPKVVETLIALVEHCGEVLSKDELMGIIWADSFVEEGNLTQNLYLLRKVLQKKPDGTPFIETLKRRGYRFTGDVFRTEAKSAKQISASKIQFPAAENDENQTAENLWQIIGREKEISQVKNLLSQKDVRLVTLAGVGGTGKTRLAQKLAQELAANFADGVFFVELAAITNPELVVSTIAQTLGIKEAGDKAVAENLKNFLRDKQILLVIDNFEQVIDAAPIVAEFISCAEKLKILVTSRTRLNLSAEREFIVPPLELPNGISNVSLDELSKYEAIELFVRRARNAKSNFALTKENAETVAEICRRLDGLPLAIELAAARIKILSPSAILERLENQLNLLTGGAKDLPERQQTMRGTVEWSYDLLTDDEKNSFRCLAVFANGFTIEAAETIVNSWRSLVSKEEISNKKSADNTRPPINVLDDVTSLLGQSLLVSKEQPDGGQRFRMLEVVREYAFELLEKHDEAKVARRAHADYFIGLLKAAEPHFLSAESPKWIAPMQANFDNMRNALNWLSKNDGETAASLAGVICYFWSRNGHTIEGTEWFEIVLRQSAEFPAILRIKLLVSLGVLNRLKANFPSSQNCYKQALTLAAQENDLANIAVANRGLGVNAYQQGDFTAARKYIEDGLAISRQLDDQPGIATSLNIIGDLARTEGDHRRARPCIEEALAISRKLGKQQGICDNGISLGLIAYEEGDFENQQLYFIEVMETARKLKDVVYTIYCFDGFASLAVKSRQLKRATRLAGAAQSLRDSSGHRYEPVERRFLETYLAELKSKIAEADFSELYEQGRKLDLEEAVALCSEETEQAAALYKSESAVSEPNFFNPANAFEACQLARIYFQQSTMPTYVKARELLEEAIRLDADYAPAYVALSELCIKEAIYNLSSLALGFDGAKNALERAADLNANSAEFYAAKGFFALVADWNFDEATQNLHKSLAINPHCAFANNYLGQVFMFRCEFDKAETYLRRAVKIEPTGLYNHGMLIISYFLARNYKKSLELLDKYFAISPQSVACEQILCWNLEQTGKAAEAVAKYEKHLDQPYGVFFKKCLGYAYAIAGDEENARKIAAEIVAESREHYISPVHSAIIYAALGEADEAVLHLENAFANRDPWLLWLAADPRFDNLRVDPRFQKLEKSIFLESAEKHRSRDLI